MTSLKANWRSADHERRGTVGVRGTPIFGTLIFSSVWGNKWQTFPQAGRP